jgi:hypothetical protein
MNALMDDSVTNAYHSLARGQKEILEKPYMRAVQFANKFQSKLSMSAVAPKKEEVWHNKLAESAQRTALQEFVSKEIAAEKFKDPYGYEFKKLLYDMYANDYVSAEAVNIRVWAAFAPQTEGTLMPMGDRVYQSDKGLQADLDATGYSEQERRKMIDYIEQVNRFTGFRYYQQDIGKQSFVGGRAACFIETYEGENDYDFPIGTPAIIKPLHWSYLNQVRVDSATWGLDSVRYTDFETSDTPLSFIPANRLFYIVRNDNMIIPNSLWYGLSDFHSIWKVSNIIRQAEEIDFPEIVTSMWAGGGIFKFTNMNTTEMDNFMESLGPGLYRGFNSRIDYLPMNLKHDGWFLMTLLQNMISHLLMKLRVPEFLYSMDKATSRSAVEIQMNVFRDIVLAADRWWMERHLQDQWYDHLIGLWTNEPDPKKHKLRFVQKYAPLSFEDILAKANSLELLARRYFIDRFEGRQLLGLRPENKNLDTAVNPIGQLLDLSPVEKIKFDQQKELQEKRMEQQKQTTIDQFGGSQKGFQPPPIRSNSAPIGTKGAGRGNTT